MIKKVLVTGGYGFIGSHFIDLVIKNKIRVINIDNLSKGSNLKNLNYKSKYYKFYKVSINNNKIINEIINFEEPEAIVNFAAETHVDRSIKKPMDFIKTNVNGLTNIALAYKNFLNKNKKNKYKFIQISTDEVYGSTKNKPFIETDNLKPNSPYSSSKTSADLILRSLDKTFNFKSIILRPSNNFGPRQFEEKLIPLSLMKLKNRKKIPIYGDGKNRREWFYVKDCVKTIFNILKSNIYTGIFNIGSANIISNLELITLLCKKYTKKNTKQRYFKWLLIMY